MMALQCRLCLDEDVWVNLIRPCNCDGSIRYVHQSCLERYEAYRSEQGQVIGKCPVCNTSYKYLNRTALKGLSLQVLVFVLLFTQPFTLERLATQVCLLFTFLGQLHTMEQTPWQHLYSLQLICLPSTLVCLAVEANFILPLTHVVSIAWNIRHEKRGNMWLIANILIAQIVVMLYIYGDLTNIYIHLLCMSYMQIIVVANST